MNPLAQLSNNAKFRLIILLFCGAAVIVSLWPGESIRDDVLAFADSRGVRSDDPHEGAEAAKLRVLHHGVKAVPVLVQMLRTSPSPLELLLKKIDDLGWNRWGWKLNCEERIRHQKSAALSGLELFGASGLAAKPEVERLLFDRHLNNQAAYVLASYGKPLCRSLWRR